MYQKTIAEKISFSGKGLHSGLFANITIKPSKPNTGITFIYINKNNRYEIQANINNLHSTKRGIILSSITNKYKIYTIEHLLSALYALEIDNVIIEIDNIEVPILDGSSIKFIKKIISNGGVKILGNKKKYITIKKDITIKGNDESYIKILPYDGFKITFEIDYNNKNIGNQKFTLNSLNEYYNEIASSRTFCTFDEIVFLRKENLAKGGDFSNSIIYSDDSITMQDIIDFNNNNKIKIIESIDQNKTTINNKKLFFKDEAVRHKILDLVGDLALLGKNIKGHIISYKGGHYLNTQLVKELSKLTTVNKEKCLYNKEQIKLVLPHRDPFLLIDEIIDIQKGKFVHATKYIKNNEIFLEGHFPGNPIVPGVLIIECLAQASCFLSLTTIKNYKQKLMLLSVIKKAKFIKKVVPGDKLDLKVNLVKFKLNNAIIKGEALVNNNVVASAEWMATIVNRYEN